MPILGDWENFGTARESCRSIKTSNIFSLYLPTLLPPASLPGAQLTTACLHSYLLAGCAGAGQLAGSFSSGSGSLVVTSQCQTSPVSWMRPNKCRVQLLTADQRNKIRKSKINQMETWRVTSDWDSWDWVLRAGLVRRQAGSQRGPRSPYWHCTEDCWDDGGWDGSEVWKMATLKRFISVIMLTTEPLKPSPGLTISNQSVYPLKSCSVDRLGRFRLVQSSSTRLCYNSPNAPHYEELDEEFSK